jgi:hypothetical protein
VRLDAVAGPGAIPRRQDAVRLSGSERASTGPGVYGSSRPADQRLRVFVDLAWRGLIATGSCTQATRLRPVDYPVIS